MLGRIIQPMARMSALAAGSVILLLVGLAAGYSLARVGDDTDGSEVAQQDHVATAAGSEGASDLQAGLVAVRRDAIEDAYPEFRDFEEQQSFAGRSVRTEFDDGDYYVAYLVHGSGVPIAQAACFRVDRVGRVFQVGVFPDPVDSYAGYRDLNLANCRGIK